LWQAGRLFGTCPDAIGRRDIRNVGYRQMVARTHKTRRARLNQTHPNRQASAWGWRFEWSGLLRENPRVDDRQWQQAVGRRLLTPEEQAARELYFARKADEAIETVRAREVLLGLGLTSD
ncbi:MAG: hypothetical protein ACLFVU_12360, partial [Phycisphaerae bacterium]